MKVHFVILVFVIIEATYKYEIHSRLICYIITIITIITINTINTIITIITIITINTSITSDKLRLFRPNSPKANNQPML